MKNLSLFLITAVALAGGGCSHEKRVTEADAAKVRIDEAPDVNVLKVDHGERFPLVSAGTRSTADELKVNGSVSPDVSRAVPVNALAGGRVVEIKARLGDTVRKGQVLLLINSPDLSMAFSDYQKFQVDDVLSKKALERSQLLYDHGAIALKELQVAEDTEQKSLVDLTTAETRIRILGGDPKHISSMFEVRAPVSGTITEQNVTASAGVKSPDNAPNLFTISDLSRVWVLCDVYENNLSQVHLGDFANVQLNAYQDRVLKGRVSNISRVLDPTTRTAKVRLELDNSRGLLSPGMFASVTFTSRSKQQRTVIPASAVIRLHDRDWVFRPDGTNRFRRVAIQAGPALGDGFQEILGGLSPGDRVVSNALQLESATEQS